MGDVDVPHPRTMTPVPSSPSGVSYVGPPDDAIILQPSASSDSYAPTPSPNAADPASVVRLSPVNDPASSAASPVAVAASEINSLGPASLPDGGPVSPIDAVQVTVDHVAGQAAASVTSLAASVGVQTRSVVRKRGTLSPRISSSA